MEEGGEPRTQLVVTGGDAPELLQAGEEALYKIAVLVLGPVHGARGLAVAQLRNHWRGAQSLDVSHYRRGVVRLVGGDRCNRDVGAIRHLIQQSFSLDTVVYVAPSQGEVCEVAKALDCGVDFGCQATTRAPYGLGAVFF